MLSDLAVMRRAAEVCGGAAALALIEQPSTEAARRSSSGLPAAGLPADLLAAAGRVGARAGPPRGIRQP